MEYIIQEFSEKYGWCLFSVCKGDSDFANKCLEEARKQFPDKQLRVATVKSEDCWWNDPFLAN